MTTWFTSDPHWGHANILKYCKRPFRDLEHMHQELRDRWNARVSPEDTVYLLGDFAMGPKEFIGDYRRQLNGRIVLVLGNHDRSYASMRAAGFDEVYKSLLYATPEFDVLLRHIPDMTQNEAMAQGLGVSIRQRYHLCGHVHEAWARRGNVINVGVDVRDFEPKTLAELLA